MLFEGAVLNKRRQVRNLISSLQNNMTCQNIWDLICSDLRGTSQADVQTSLSVAIKFSVTTYDEKGEWNEC